MASAKRPKEQDPPENHERWLITYADLITLLMIFFIIMYTMAKVDTQKFKAVSESLAGALGGNGSGDVRLGNQGILTDLYKPPKVETSGNGNGDGKGGGEQARLDSLESKLVQLINKYNLQDYINISQEERGLDIEIRNELFNSVVFESGSAELSAPAQDIITKIGYLLKELPENSIRVEGHTDNIPINNSSFKSNWELSSARATTVVKFLINNIDISPLRMSAVGYAEFKPVAKNDTTEGRAKNRRVNIVIIKNKYNAVEGNAPTTNNTEKQQ